MGKKTPKKELDNFIFMTSQGCFLRHFVKLFSYNVVNITAWFVKVQILNVRKHKLLISSSLKKKKIRKKKNIIVYLTKKEYIFFNKNNYPFA